jgi:hydrogenase maturation protein HypF
MGAAHISMQARRILVSGQVQGVGFRPFVHGLAARHSLAGWVRNGPGRVEVHVQGRSEALDAFVLGICSEAPVVAKPQVEIRAATPDQDCRDFAILESKIGAPAHVHLPQDRSVCVDCLHEMQDPGNRRYRHPFISCTRCGPRYTLIKRLPYDRGNTAMAAFPLCAACRAEYSDPGDRRFHAEIIACPDCGPKLQFVMAGIRTNANALSRAVAALCEGRIVAVKGVGGYHLMCDAGDDAAIARLRTLKPRPHKPLAVLVPAAGKDGLDAARVVADMDVVEAGQLASPERPIVLVARRSDCSLSQLIAPGMAAVGVMLPYSPLHQLVASDFGRPLVATSANLRGDPVLTDAAEAEQRLAHVADAWLHHDRPILRPADDAVVRVMAGRPRTLRPGRGLAPLEFELPFTLREPVLATGSHMKNAVALGWDRRAIVSQHVGDLDSPRSLLAFEQAMADLQRLYGVKAARVLHDAHPDYAGSRYARRCGLPTAAIPHHRAHASALAGEHPEVRRWLVFAWDGVGLGDDGTLWGSEMMLGSPGAWKRIGSFRPFRLPGGERAARQPWRSALALCWEAGIEWPACPEDTALLRLSWERGVNAPQSCGAGRLFDAAAALAGVNTCSSFEGQGPMMLEALAGPGAPPVDMPCYPDAEGVIRIDWAPLLPMLMDASRSSAERASVFHASLARGIVEQALAARREHGDLTVGLAGGVFQNRLLVEQACTELNSAGMDVRLASRLPVNDAGIGYGQIIEFAAR